MLSKVYKTYIALKAMIEWNANSNSNSNSNLNSNSNSNSNSTAYKPFTHLN
jgi:hypothetical protein